MTRAPYILAVGGAHIDRRGQVSGAYVPAASNPGTMREDVGGGVFNALRTTVRRGASASLASLRGGDAAAETVARAIREAGIEDLSAVFLDRTTPSYTAILDAEGELVVGFADMGLYDLAFPKQVRRAKLREAAGAADALLLDANLPEAALERLVPSAGGKPVFAIAISPAKAVRLKPIVDRLTLLFMNRREAAALTGLNKEAPAADIVAGLRAAGLKDGVVSAGSGPMIGYDAQGAFTVMPPEPRHVADVTGAGDALAGATVAGLLFGQSLRQALREGVAAALLAIESPLAVPAFTAADFAAALALVPKPQEMA
ncbi:MAG: carbohydrate kinase family protein [Mesorhizobium sp.]|nr:carbohydrate kinase family protein [Mesorhizobium sp.]MBN9244115.1 carbohydrate kinase family protein [Mesorhizobium sp.]